MANRHSVARGGTTPEQEFPELAEQWRRDTRFSSSLVEMVLHPAYQRIIGLGGAALPLLLRELQREPDHWFWALRAISGEDPAASTSTIDDARDGWLKWGTSQGYIT